MVNVMKTKPHAAWIACAARLFVCPSLPGQVLLPQLKKAAATEALNNARQIGLALIDFEAECGSFPTAVTRKKVEEATGAKKGDNDVAAG
jgi:hypothetical protein